MAKFVLTTTTAGLVKEPSAWLCFSDPGAAESEIEGMSGETEVLDKG